MKSIKLLNLLLIVLMIGLLAGCDFLNRGGTQIETEYVWITFNSTGGNDIDSLRVEKGTSFSLPTPTKDGFIFDGWYLSEGLDSVLFTPGTIVNENITLYALWVEIESNDSPEIPIAFIDQLMIEINRILYYETDVCLDDATEINLSYLKFDLIGLYDDWLDKHFEQFIIITGYLVVTIPNNGIDEFHGIGFMLDDGFDCYPLCTYYDGIFSAEELDLIAAYLLEEEIMWTEELEEGIDEGFITGYTVARHNFDFIGLSLVTLLSSNILVEEDDLVFIVAVDEAVVIGLNKDSDSVDIVIPETVQGIPVRAIFTNAFYSSSIISIEIASNIVTIGVEAFSRSDLETIIFKEGSSLESIGDYAFSGTNISSIIIPASVATIGRDALSFSQHLETISVDPLNQHFVSLDGVLFNKTLTELIVYPRALVNIEYEIPASVIHIHDYAFHQAYDLGSITFEEGSLLESIGRSAFEYLNIQSIHLPASLKNIGSYAFYGSGLETVTFEEGSLLESIGDYAFSITNFSSIIIPASVVTIGTGALTTGHLETISVDPLNQNFVSLDGVLFNKTLTELIVYPHALVNMEYEIPASVIHIHDNAFDQAYALGLITFEEGSLLESIGRSAFSGATISSIIIPASVTTIGAEAFAWSSLVTISFEEGSILESIGAFAFSETNISSIILPASLKHIDGYAFAWSSLVTISFEEGSILESIGSNAFLETNISSIIIPASVVTMGERVFSPIWGSVIEHITINVIAESKPIDWHENWIGRHEDDVTVVWGYE